MNEFDMWDEYDGLDALDEDALDAWDDLEDGFEDDLDDGFEEDGFEEDGFEDDLFEEDGFEDDLFEDDLFEDDGMDLDGFEADGFEDEDAFNELVLDALDADDADAFLRRIGGFFRNAAQRVGAGLRTVGRAVAPALPMLQRAVGFLGPWGRLASAGIGAVRGLASGRGLRGALAGAVGGLIPGAGGQMASRLLGGAGMDDDAALDALADLADADELDEAVATPIGAGLATRLIVRGGVQRGAPLSGRARRRLYRRVRRAERELLAALRSIPGSVGRRLRLLRFISRATAVTLARQPRAVAVRALPSALRRVSQVVVRAAIRRPTAARVTPAVAARRTRARRRVVQTARRTGALAQVTRRQAAARRMIVARRGATLRPTLRAPMRRRRPR